MLEIKDLVMHPIQLIGVELVDCRLFKNQIGDKDISLDNMNVNLKSWGEVDNTKNGLGYSYLNLIIDFKDGEKPFYINITYRAICLFENQNYTSEEYISFLQAQGLKLLWPYIKPSLSDFMIKMDIDPLKLPTLDVLKTMEKAKQNKEVR